MGAGRALADGNIRQASGMRWISDGAGIRSEGDGDGFSRRPSAGLDALGREVVEELVDYVGFGDDGENPHGGSTASTEQWVDLVHELE